MLCIYQSKVHTHSSEHTHTVNTHPEQWAAIYAAAPGEQLGVRCLAQGHLSHGIDDQQFHQQFLPARDSNSQLLDYESDSLTIRPRLPHGDPCENSYPYRSQGSGVRVLWRAGVDAGESLEKQESWNICWRVDGESIR